MKPNKRQLVWQSYRNYKMLAFVPRAGYGSCGIYPYDFDHRKWEAGDEIVRPESDLEHTAGIMHLARAISWHYPEIIPPEQLGDFLFGAEIHELGELIEGDTLDDGTRNDEEKDFFEGNEIRKFLYKYAEYNDYRRGLELYEQMRDKNTEFGQTLYFLDKLEAVLQAGLYESLGHPGLLSEKKRLFGSMSKRDEKYSAAVKSDNIFDTWAYILVVKMKELDYKYANIFASIVTEAAIDIRKKPFSWIEFTENS